MFCDSFLRNFLFRVNSSFLALIEFTQPVLVKREDPNSRVNTIKEIQRRAQTKGEWPQIVIFPEGTCTNRSCLITFKQGKIRLMEITGKLDIYHYGRKCLYNEIILLRFH